MVLVFYLLLLVTVYLLIARSHLTYRLPIDWLNNTDIYSHISNFTISYNLVSIIGFIWLLQGVSMRIISIACFVIISLNFIFELFITVLNTRDMVDAYYGVGGTAMAYVFLLIAKKWGLKAFPSSQP